AQAAAAPRRSCAAGAGERCRIFGGEWCVRGDDAPRLSQELGCEEEELRLDGAGEQGKRPIRCPIAAQQVREVEAQPQRGAQDGEEVREAVRPVAAPGL